MDTFDDGWGMKIEPGIELSEEEIPAFLKGLAETCDKKEEEK